MDSLPAELLGKPACWLAPLSAHPELPPILLAHRPVQAAIRVASGDPKLQVEIRDLTIEGKPATPKAQNQTVQPEEKSASTASGYTKTLRASKTLLQRLWENCSLCHHHRGVSRLEFYIVVMVWLLSCVWLFCNPVDSSPPGSSVHGIFQARILEWVTISFPRGSFRPRC